MTLQPDSVAKRQPMRGKTDKRALALIVIWCCGMAWIAAAKDRRNQASTGNQNVVALELGKPHLPGPPGARRKTARTSLHHQPSASRLPVRGRG